MKCPRCGFIDFAGLDRCKKCGQPFPTKEPQERPSPNPSLFSASAFLASMDDPDVADSVSEGPPSDVPSSAGAPAGRLAGATSPPTTGLGIEGVPAWREELSQRVENFRRRRARLRGRSKSSTNLEFDFGVSDPGVPDAEIGGSPHRSVREEAEVNTELDRPLRHASRSALVESIELEREDERGSFLEYSEVENEDAESDLQALPGPVEFVLDSAPPRQEPNAIPVDLPIASLGRRFMGGVIDATVLLLASGVFALIFSRAGGRVSLTPLNLVVVGFIGVFLMLSYFGAFTALTSTTPGLLWMGVEIRSLEGGHPTPRQALWRAFGYLVSTSALLLGFVWALVDSEGLTWHDRMSDTFLASMDGIEAGRRSTVDSR